MSWAIPQHHFHPFPRLCNMLMFKFLETHYLGSKGNNFCGQKHLVMKASLHLFQESILLRGKEESQFFAESHKENENNFILTTSLSTSFYFAYHIIP